MNEQETVQEQKPEETQLYRSAVTELKLAGYNVDPDVVVAGDPFSHLGIDILKVISTFCMMGLSGGMAPFIIPVITKLMSNQILTPLTGADDEWELMDPDFTGRPDMYQNIRDSRIFKHGKAGEAYAVGTRIFQYPYTDSEGQVAYSTFTNGLSQEYVSFPYKHKDPEYINIPDADYDLVVDPLNLVTGKRAAETKLGLLSSRLSVDEVEAIRLKAEEPCENKTDDGIRDLLKQALEAKGNEILAEALINGAPYLVEAQENLAPDGSMLVDIYIGQAALERKYQKDTDASSSIVANADTPNVHGLTLSSGKVLSPMTEQQAKELDTAIDTLRKIIVTGGTLDCCDPTSKTGNILSSLPMDDSDIIYAFDPTAKANLEGAGDTTYLSPEAFDKLQGIIDNPPTPSDKLVELMSQPPKYKKGDPV